MAFTLTIDKGPDAGTAFPFSEQEAKLGRTADNDVVVKDASASRAHARVYEDQHRFFLEDLKSANGTKVNGEVIEGTRELKNGDLITIGEVAFRFTSVEPTLFQPTLPEQPALDPNATVLQLASELPPPPDEKPVDPNATMLKSPEELEAVRASWKKDAPAAEKSVDPNATFLKSPEELEKLKASWGKGGKTDETPAVRPASAELEGLKTIAPTTRKAGRQAAARPDDSTADLPADAAALSKRADDEGLQPSGGDDTNKVQSLPARSTLARGGGEAAALSAAEKARRRRELGDSLPGRLRLLWAELSRPARIASAAGASALGVGIVATLVWSLASPDDGKKVALGPEPTALVANAQPVAASFGLGPDVSYARPDLKNFTFLTQSPTRVVVLLHYQAKDISKDEVAVTLNGSDVGAVPPDTVDPAARDLELVFPVRLVKPQEENQLTFDNVRNPPGDDPWRVWNLWVEVLPTPELSAEQTLVEVRTNLDSAQKSWGIKDVGPENLYRAWKQYRNAWLLLESMPERPQELYDTVRQQLRLAQVELDKRCAALMLDVKRESESSQRTNPRMRAMLEDVLRYFPTREHRCHHIATAMMADVSG